MAFRAGDFNGDGKSNYVDYKIYTTQIDPNSGEYGRGGGCYIATAVYGSYDCPEVWTLRRFRDYVLAPTWYGRLFVKFYYAVSPTVVKWFGKEKWFRNLWKPKLDRLVKRLNENGIDNVSYQDKIW